MSLRPVETAPTALVQRADHTELPCHVDPDLWFSDVPEELEVAKGLCHGCRVRANCLIRALQRGEPCGVWGGELIRRGTVVPRKLPRGRPRKNSPAGAGRPECASEPARPPERGSMTNRDLSSPVEEVVRPSRTPTPRRETTVEGRLSPVKPG